MPTEKALYHLITGYLVLLQLLIHRIQLFVVK
jgi:hypothetical protein